MGRHIVSGILAAIAFVFVTIGTIMDYASMDGGIAGLATGILMALLLAGAYFLIALVLFALWRTRVGSILAGIAFLIVAIFSAVSLVNTMYAYRNIANFSWNAEAVATIAIHLVTLIAYILLMVDSFSGFRVKGAGILGTVLLVTLAILNLASQIANYQLMTTGNMFVMWSSAIIIAIGQLLFSLSVMIFRFRQR